MDLPDGVKEAPTSISTAGVAAAPVGRALRAARNELDDRTAPMAGLVATFVFVGQMLNFPVGLGTSGHLLGGTLAAVLVGPWTGILCLSVVLLVQALLFADGGITALGTNVALFAGYAGFRLALLVLRRRTASVAPAAALGALLSAPAAALAFTGLYAAGGVAPIPLDGLVVAMLGWHTLIGAGEAAITGLVVGSVVATRPDLVYGARGVLTTRQLEVRSPRRDGAAPA